MKAELNDTIETIDMNSKEIAEQKWNYGIDKQSPRALIPNGVAQAWGVPRFALRPPGSSLVVN